MMEHLACFLPGTVALGTLSSTDVTRNARHLAFAKEIMHTCVAMYTRQPMGLAPDSVMFPGMEASSKKHMLRPEVVESLFYLYRVTKDEQYREWGWQLFEAVVRRSKAAYGFATVKDATAAEPQVENRMESFFLAETLKYHYLLQVRGRCTRQRCPRGWF